MMEVERRYNTRLHLIEKMELQIIQKLNKNTL